MLRSRLLLSALAVGLAAAGSSVAPAQEPAPPAAAQEPVPPPEDLDVFVDTVEVSVVNVEVFVTDRKGNRITGLTRDDFEVREDGRPVEVTNFFAVEGGRPATPVAAAPEPEPEPVPGLPATEAPPALPEEQQLHLIIYIDNFNLDPLNRNRVMRDLRIFLADQVKVGDRVMLVSYDRSLKVRRPFTTDPLVIATALTELEKLTGFARQRETDRRVYLDRIEDSRSANEALTWARGWAEEVNNDLRFTMDALKSLINSLAGLPGRKAVLYVSDGVPMVPAEELFHAVQEKYNNNSAITESFNYNAARLFNELASQANANRVTFYTIDAAGLRAPSDFAAENKRAPISGVDSVNTNNLQAPLRFIAQATGGIALLNTNRITTQLDRVAEDFSTYYSLGYRAPQTQRGRYHDIDVKVKGKGLEVRHREGYRDKTPDARMSDGAMSALAFDFERNAIGLELTFGRPAPREERHYLVPVKVSIPLESIAFVPRGATAEARLRLFVAAADEDGGTSPVQQIEVPISIPAAEVELARKQRYEYSLSLLMRRGGHTVAVGLRDAIGGHEAFVTGRLRVDE